MSALRAIFGGILSGLTLDATTARNSVALRISHLVTVVTTIAAVVLSIAYQVLRHLPTPWRRWVVDRLGGTGEPEQE